MLLNVASHDGQHVLVVLVPLLELLPYGLADSIDLVIALSFGSEGELLHKCSMLKLMDLILWEWPHVFQFRASFLLHETVDKQVEPVNFLHLTNERGYVTHELVAVYIVNKVEVTFVLSYGGKGLGVLLCFNKLNDVLQTDDSRIDGFKVASGHL